jgi:hypothetical protein
VARAIFLGKGTGREHDAFLLKPNLIGKMRWDQRLEFFAGRRWRRDDNVEILAQKIPAQWILFLAIVRHRFLHARSIRARSVERLMWFRRKALPLQDQRNQKSGLSACGSGATS